MNIGWPEGIWLVFAIIGIVVSLFNDNAASRVGNILAIVLSFGLLYWGGFFA